jgi:ABC-type glycerol-3-phosphate transport system substrate-binding protein
MGRGGSAVSQKGMSRRRLLQATGMAVALAACGRDSGQGSPQAEPTAATTFSEPSRKLSGDLRILMWSHFVPQHDQWFDPFAKQWGQRVGVNVTVDHIDTAGVPARISSEVAAGQGHDVIQHIAPLPQFEQRTLDMSDVTQEAIRRHGQQLELCKRSSFNPTTNRFFAYCPSWVPDPGDYRKSLWQKVDLPNGPSTYDELLSGGARIKRELGVQLGIGMSNEVDSNMAGRALLWSFGGKVQDENERVAINSDHTIAAVEFMKRLFQQTMTDEVFGWTAASNNQGLIAGQMSYILNSISAYRTAQMANPDVARDIFFAPALKGPEAGLVASHVIYNWIIPNHAENVDAAKEFLLHYTANFQQAASSSRLYDLPAFDNLVPKLDTWLRNDPFGSQPADKLAVLADARNWSTNIGHPGPASAAIGDVFAAFVIPNMFAKVARAQRSAKEAVAEAEAQITSIFDNWRRQGLIGGGSG